LKRLVAPNEKTRPESWGKAGDYDLDAVVEIWIEFEEVRAVLEDGYRFVDANVRDQRLWHRIEGVI
jgi:hypothetical protein